MCNLLKYIFNLYIGDKAGYSGVALYSKKKPISVRMGKEIKELNDDEGRVIEAEYENFFLVSTCNTIIIYVFLMSIFIIIRYYNILYFRYSKCRCRIKNITKKNEMG